MKKALTLALLLFLLAACTPASEASPCYKAEFIDHVTLDVPVQSGTTVMPGTHFTKTWEVMNSGTCEWNESFVLVHTGGDPMGAEDLVLPSVPAGRTVDLSLRLSAPSQPGTYTGAWMLRAGTGELFGIGPAGDRPLTADLVVPDLPAGVAYDFAQVLCLARWDSGRATFLPCEGDADEQGVLDGFVRLAPNGTIEVKPNNQVNGWIAGYFPPITVQNGDHFRATVGCVDENPDCDIAFMLKLNTDGTDRPAVEEGALGNPYLLAGGQIIEIDIDLSIWQGKQVTLILYMYENGTGRTLDAIGYWRAARIENSE